MSTTENAIDATIATKPSPGQQYFEKFKITPELEAEAQNILGLYPKEHKEAAVLPLLHEIQKRFGYICGDSIIWVAETIGSTPAQVLGVVTFYPGIRQTCPGKFHIRVCRTLSCAMQGSAELVDTLCEKLGIDRASINHNNPVGISPCGKWSVEFVECLAQCGFGPAVLVNDDLHSEVTPDKADALISNYKD